MKRFLVTGFLTMCLMFTMTGCGEDKNNEATAPTNTPAEEATHTPAAATTTPNNDMDDNDDLSEDIKDGVDNVGDGIKDAVDGVDDAVDDTVDGVDDAMDDNRDDNR